MRQLAIAALFTLLACGTTTSGSLLSGGGEAGAAPEEIVCPEGHEVMVVPAVRESGGCVATNQQEVFSVCVDSTPEQFALACLEREADNARFWFSYPRLRVAPPVGYVDCNTIYPPPSCEFDACSDSGGFLTEHPFSVCGKDNTIEGFDCGGPNSVYDASCCVRTFCDEAPCAAGFTCRSVPLLSKWAGPFTDGEETSDCLVYEDTEFGPTNVELCFPE